MFLAVYSAFTGAPVDGEIALTGEIGLRGQVLPVGGVSDKLAAAEEAGVQRAFIPKENWRDAFSKLSISVEPLENVDELLEKIFRKGENNGYVDESGILTAQEGNSW